MKTKNKRGSAWIWVVIILIAAVGVGIYLWLGGDAGSVASGGNSALQPPALPD